MEVPKEPCFGAKETAKEACLSSEAGIFKAIGSFGPWQKKVFLVFFLMNSIGIWQNFAVTFLAPNMDYWCVAPLSSEQNRTSRVAVANASASQCEVWISDELDGNRSVPCTQWEYDTSEYHRTIVNEWNLVCEREWLVSFAKSIYMIGFMLSVLIFGQVSDALGRFPTIMVCYFITTVSSTISALSTSYTMFVILRFFAAFGRTGMTTTGYVLLMEIVGPEWRTAVGVTIQFAWCVGFVTLPALAYYIRTWYWFQLAIGLPTVPMVCVYWLVPESPRWLMTQGKKKRFMEVVTRASKENGQQLDDETLLAIVAQNFGKKQKSGSKTKTFFDLIRTPLMARRTLCMAILWMINAFVYYALSYNTNDLGGDSYLNFFISGLMEFPSYALIYFTITRFGRKVPLLVGMVLGGVACAAIMAVPPEMTWLVVTLSMIGKVCITSTFGLLYVYTTEMFPTVVRNISIGTCSTCGRIGSITAPFVRELERATHYTVPFAVNAGLAILTSLLVFFLPETKDKKIPDTMEEGEMFEEETSLVDKPQKS